MKNKKRVIIILIIIILILIIGTGTALAYLKTDLFKTNKQLFLKYISELGQVVNEFDDEELNAYFEKQNVTPYSNEGKLSVNINVPSVEEEFKNANAVNITFSGKRDENNKKQEQKISLNYSDTVSFPIEYKRDGDLYALTSNIVVNKFIAIKNDGLKQLLLKCGLNDVSTIPDKIEQNEMTSSELEDKLNEILEKCGNILVENLKDSNFSKVDKDKIALTLSQEEVKTIMLKLLEELKNDVYLLGNSEEELQAEMEDLINEFSEIEATTDEALKIIAHRNNNKLSNIEIQLAEYTTMNIQVEDSKITIMPQSSDGEDIRIVVEKLKEENSVNYNMNYSQYSEDIDLSFYINMKFSGISTNNAEENYIIGFNAGDQSQNMSYEYTFNTKKAFTDMLEIEGLTSENSVILNDCTEEYINSLLPAIGNRIIQVNEEQMRTLGVTQNPLIMATPIGYIYSMISTSVNEEADKNRQEFEQQSEEEQQLEELDKKASNLVFEKYAGERVTGNTVKILLQIINNNLLDSANNKVKTIVYNDYEIEVTSSNISQIQKDISTAVYYKVSLEYNPITQLIEKVIIQKNN